MNISSSELGQITHDVCESMLGLQLAQTSEFPCEPAMVASIQISGSWNAAIEVAVCDSAANSIANAMFDSDDVDSKEIADAVSEVANMIGGNIKGIAGGDCELSLPSIGQSNCHHSDEVEIAFELGDGGVQVSLKS